MANTKKRFISAGIAALMLCCTFAMPTKLQENELLSQISIVQTLSVDAASGRLYNQYSGSWSDELHDSGCGLFATANAIYALNGKKMDMNSFATWAKSVGGWRPGDGGTYRDDLYPKITAKYGNTYGFQVVNNGVKSNVYSSTLINHLKNGGVAVAHVYKHFIAIVGYDTSSKKYHVIESAFSSNRSLSADSWVTGSKLNSGKTNVDWFCLISSTSSSNGGGDCFKKYTGSSTSIVTALNAIGVDSSYNYRKSIAAANGISNYSGTASQNTTMLNKLKAGTLKKPGSSTSSTTTCFPKYTGSSTSIVTALNAVGADSSYSYRKSIAAANGISNYSGTASQNTTMLNKLKAGTLKKP